MKISKTEETEVSAFTDVKRLQLRTSYLSITLNRKVVDTCNPKTITYLKRYE